VISVPAAEALAARAHGDDRSDAGVLVIDHVRSVAARMRSDPDVYAVPASLLHDTVERSGTTFDDLRAAGADDRLIALVDLLTQREGEADERYLSRVAADPLAVRIKQANIADKLDRLGDTSLGEADRQAVEHRARRRLALLDTIVRRFELSGPDVL
jgi:(p)ppGpp synthase/HD superfamily hydrolase